MLLTPSSVCRPGFFLPLRFPGFRLFRRLPSTDTRHFSLDRPRWHEAVYRLDVSVSCTNNPLFSDRPLVSPSISSATVSLPCGETTTRVSDELTHEPVFATVSKPKELPVRTRTCRCGSKSISVLENGSWTSPSLSLAPAVGLSAEGDRRPLPQSGFARGKAILFRLEMPRQSSRILEEGKLAARRVTIMF